MKPNAVSKVRRGSPLEGKARQIRSVPPATLSCQLPFYFYAAEQANIRHADKIQFTVWDVEHDEDCQEMIREFVEDLAKAGIQTVSDDRTFKS